MNKSRIPYLAVVDALRWDIITGCDNDGDICEVKKLNLCWAEMLSKDFAPDINYKLFESPRRLKKPRVIAVGFGGELYSEKFKCDIKLIEGQENDQDRHLFIHLTKLPFNIHRFLDNVWYGCSITGAKHDEQKLERMVYLSNQHKANVWISFEPLLHPIDVYLKSIGFIVIGGLSDGNGRIIPPSEGGTRPEWVQPILNRAYASGTKVFLKNLQPIIRDLIDPRTGMPFRNQNEWRDIPSSWELYAKSEASDE